MPYFNLTKHTVSFESYETGVGWRVTRGVKSVWSTLGRSGWVHCY